MRTRPALWLVLAALTTAPSARADTDVVSDAAEAITAMEVDKAKKLLSPLDPTIPRVSYQLGRLAMEVGDCDEAAKRLSLSAVQQVFEDAGALLNVARTCARAMAATIVVEDKEHDVIVRLQDDADRSLVPIIGETVALQREVLAKDLGVVMPKPSRVDVVRDQFSLAALTGLPHQAAQTTGTVAIAKFGRVIMLSPRAPTLGYSWRDTLAHELTHLALTRGTLDRAPLWLQEGVAKREETRWRAHSPTDDVIAADAVAAVGLAKGLGRPLDGIGPSIALLPSAREAMVVYAEVTSFVRFISGDRAGAPGAPTDVETLPKIVKAYARGLDTDAALKEVTGKDLKAWNGVWKPWVATQPTKLPKSLGLDSPAPGSKESKEAAKNAHGDGRTFRIGELLLGRGHARAARTRLDPLAARLVGDPLVSSRAASARLLDGDASGALRLLDPTNLLGDLGSFWAVRGEALRATGGSVPDIVTAYTTAVAHDPFLEPVACGWADALTTPGDPLTVLARELCETARARAFPKVGQD
jgi:hypothetical protein